MDETTSPQFIQILLNGLTHWQQLTQELDDAGIIAIDSNRSLLHEIISMGLSLPQLCALATDVALQSFFLAERRGYWPQWMAFYKRALDHCQAISPQKRGHLLHRLGELYRLAHRLEEAVKVHKQAEALTQAQGDDQALAEARYRLAWDYLEMRQYGEAEACGQYAIDTFTQLGVRADLLTNSYWALGSLARRRGDLDRAQELLSQAREIAHTSQQPTHRARMVEELGIIMSAKGLYEKALAYYDEAVEILAATASERDKVSVLNNRAVAFYWQERWPEAQLDWRQAINSAYLRQSGDSHLQAMVAYNLATALLKTDDLAEAEAQLNYALQLRLELQEDVPLASTMGSLGQLRAKQGRRAEAISLFEQARPLLEAYPDDAYAQGVLQVIEGEMKNLEN